MFHGYREGTDMFKIDPTGDWVDRNNPVLAIEGSPPFVYATDQKIPKGLVLDRHSGLIHGVPSVEHYAEDFVIKASNRVGSMTYSVRIEVLDPPTNLVYRENCQNSKLGLHREFYPFRCNVDGTANALCGHLRFSVGRDPVQTKMAFDEFDADGSGELDAEEFRQMLVVLGLALSDEETADMMRGMGKDPKNSAVTFADFWKYFNTGLPKGLEINPDNGEITGVPVAETPTSMYVITCWNPVGETSTTIIIEVQEAPHSFKYRFTDCLYKLNHPYGYERLPPEKVDPLTLYECGTEFATNTLFFLGSKVSFSIYPPLPDGLTFEEKNATIAGTPKDLTPKSGKIGDTESRKYQITGKNEVGKTTIDVWIEVSKVATVLRFFKHDLVYSMGEEIRDNEVIVCDATRPVRYQAQRDPVFAKQIFDKFDVDQGGSLDRDEFRSCLRDLGEKFSDKEFRWILSQVDTDKSGVIEYDEFWEFWKPLPYGLECDEKSGVLYGRPLRQCEPGNFEVTVFNKVGSFSTMININVLDESLSRERDADRRRQFWYTGQRNMLYPNGENYEGGWKNGKWDGFGVYTKPDGYKYEGHWKRGKRHGECTESFPDGFWYKGEYMEGIRQGKGHLKWPNGNEYKGEFADGKREGEGYQSWKMDNGEEYSYDGSWLNDLQHGSGIVTEKGERCEVVAKYGSILLQRPGERVVQEFDFDDGSFYQGESAVTSTPGVFNLHGKGYKTWENGDTYEGDFYKGKRHGWGTFSWANGDRYEGGWNYGKFHGHGIYKESDRAFAVWHEKGVCESRAPVARIPVTVANENFTGMSKNHKMLSYYGEPQCGQERVGFEEAYVDNSILTGYRDGTDFFTTYSKQLRTGTVLPSIKERGRAAALTVKKEVGVLMKMTLPPPEQFDTLPRQDSKGSLKKKSSKKSIHSKDS
jgi:Ca2+-binding EF-hand superfamily protein